MKYNQTIIQIANRANHLDAVPLGKISFLLDLEIADR